MTYSVLFTKSARKELDRLPDDVAERCLEALGYLSQNPFSRVLQVKKLAGPDALYRLRIGDYRIVYEIQKHQLIVLVIKIGHRGDVYR